MRICVAIFAAALGAVIAATAETATLDTLEITRNHGRYELYADTYLAALPQDIFEVEERKKDIVYSSRTRLNTDLFHEKHKLRRAILKLRDRMPEELREDPEVRELCELGQGDGNEITIVHVIYKRKHYESQSKDYEFSQLSMREHWQAGYEDTLNSIRCPEWRAPLKNREGLHIFDMQRYIDEISN